DGGVPDAPPEHSARDWRREGDPAAGGIRFVDADDVDAALCSLPRAIRGAHRHDGTETNLIGGLPAGIDDLGARDARGQLARASAPDREPPSVLGLISPVAVQPLTLGLEFG